MIYKAEFDSLSPELMGKLKKIDRVSVVEVLHDNVVRVVVSKDYDLRPFLARSATEYSSLLLSCEREEHRWKNSSCPW